MVGESPVGANRAVFFDRDGVIVEAVVRGGRPYPPDDLASMRLTAGAKDTLNALKAAGFLIIVVTNQPDVATGRQTRAVVESMHRKLSAELPIDEIKACFCVEGDGCDCYKPKPGMLLEAAADWDIDLGRSYIVGDRWRDVGAGRAAGCITIFLDMGYEEQRPDSPDFEVSDLEEAGRVVLAGKSE